MVSCPPDLKLTHLLQEASKKKRSYARHGAKWYANQKERREENQKERREEKKKERREEKKKRQEEKKMQIVLGRVTKKGPGRGKKSRKWNKFGLLSHVNVIQSLQ